MDAATQKFVDRYCMLGLLGSPCRPEQVTALERHLETAFPPAYRAYLLVAGLSPPPALIGSDCTLDYLYDLRGWAEELLEEWHRPFELSKQAVVFLMHQGYVFLYFQAGGGNEDPAVFRFLEGDPGPVQKSERFSDWVADVSAY